MLLTRHKIAFSLYDDTDTSWIEDNFGTRISAVPHFVPVNNMAQILAYIDALCSDTERFDDDLYTKIEDHLYYYSDSALLAFLLMDTTDCGKTYHAVDNGYGNAVGFVFVDEDGDAMQEAHEALTLMEITAYNREQE